MSLTFEPTCCHIFEACTMFYPLAKDLVDPPLDPGKLAPGDMSAIHTSTRTAKSLGLPARNVTGLYSIGRVCSELMRATGRRWHTITEVSADITAPINLDADCHDVKLTLRWAEVEDGTTLAFELALPESGGKQDLALRNGVIRFGGGAEFSSAMSRL